MNTHVPVQVGFTVAIELSLANRTREFILVGSIFSNGSDRACTAAEELCIWMDVM